MGYPVARSGSCCSPAQRARTLIFFGKLPGCKTVSCLDAPGTPAEYIFFAVKGVSGNVKNYLNLCNLESLAECIFRYLIRASNVYQLIFIAKAVINEVLTNNCFTY